MALFVAILVLFSGSLHAYDGSPAPKVADEKPKELAGVGLEEKLGAKIDLALQVKDENGQAVALGSFFDGKHPVIANMGRETGFTGLVMNGNLAMQGTMKIFSCDQNMSRCQ